MIDRTHASSNRVTRLFQCADLGDVAGEVPLPADALEAIKLYRENTGRPALPPNGTDKPLVMDLSGAGRPLSDRAIYAIVKEVCRRVANSVATDHPDLARQIDSGSTHWLRHTSASHQINRGVDRHENALALISAKRST
jgi:site-specific recombinase XerD